MDKKNTTIGVICIIAAFASLYLGQKFAPPPPATPPLVSTAVVKTVNAATGSATVPGAPAPTTTIPALSAVVKDAPAAALTTLENDYITVHFTNFGGAIRDIALRKFPAELGHPLPYVFNAVHTDPMLGFVDFPGLDRNTGFELVSSSATEVVYRAVFAGEIEVTRHYSLVATPDDTHDPYQLRNETTFRNLTDKPASLARFALSLGTTAPISDSVYGQLVTTGYSDGSSQTFIPRTKLDGGSGFLGVGASEMKPSLLTSSAITWASVDNQFFVGILTPDQPGVGLLTSRVKLLPAAPDTQHNAFGVSGAAQFDLTPLPAHGESTLGLSFYVGPKEYRRLSKSAIFKADQDKVMQFGFFKWFSQLLLTLMTWVHSGVPNWGVAIILTTLLLKVIFLPFTLAASRSAKRMQKIQPEMQAVREKFKDNPQKLQSATMELFKKHKVNPLGGCIPILITLPFFFGFFQMLRSAAELRFQPFLWASDLSVADTVGHVFGVPINIMPILMGATTIISMRLTPQPSVDNAQAKMIKFMPWIMTLLCYSFSCSLALYSTVNGLFTIGQQLVINRMKDEGDVASPAGMALEDAAALAGKPMKNVTPKKPKK
ncbi:MAG: YidC/Oxa1 family membrane protein insertase [Verrucomicrobia bacterium]|nr:MAG: YidC/Oxa1 family membrane protein insertase [Verrucomicrobiota bacterium]